MAVPLARKALEPLLRTANDDPHPGLLLQRGLMAHKEHGDSPDNAKHKHIRRICSTKPSDFYKRAFTRWQKKTDDNGRFSSVRLALESRLFIGLAGGGMMETGCAISHSYGMPYIPGSSVKGVVRAHARSRLLRDGGEAGEDICNELFGTPSLAGLIHFHDAWWAPGSSPSPFVEEVVTTHHMGYYSTEGAQEATDFDSPVPNAQVAVQGSFLFVLEGAAAWFDLAKKMLVDALCTRGIGAKTRAGYGYFAEATGQEPRATCAWVDGKINEFAAAPHAMAREEALRGQRLAKAWAEIEDLDLKQAAWADIRARWEERGWWENPPGKASQKAKQLYDQHADSQSGQVGPIGVVA